MKKIWERIQGDIIGGATAAIVALPLALAFGIASGAGAVSGLYASIFGGLVAAVFGGCGVQITGPTGAMTAVLVSIVSQHGVGGMFLAALMAGLMQVIFGLMGLGKFVKYLPRSVIAGFTNGVSILFFMTAIGDALDTLSITIITVAAIVLAMRFIKKVPESLFGLAIGLIVNELFIHSPHIVGELPFQIPKLVLATMPFGSVSKLIMPAFTICLLGSISALLSAEVTDEMIDASHDSNRELIGQGLGNIMSSLIGGIPVSGAVARSGVNINSGGRTRLSSILHSIFLLLMILVFGSIVRRIPLASLAAILMVASVRTADWNSLKQITRAPWTYGAIMTITTILTVVKDLTIAVAVGVGLAGIVALVELASLPDGKLVDSHNSSANSEPGFNDVEIISFNGPLLFVGVENFQNKIRKLSGKPIKVLDFSNVSLIDETGALAINDTILKLQSKGKSIYIGGLRRKPLRTLIRMGVVDSLGRDHVCKSMDAALHRATTVPRTSGKTKSLLADCALTDSRIGEYS